MVDQNESSGKRSISLRKMPITSGSDVEFSNDFADEDDFEAKQRSEAASRRVSSNKGE
jgi:hypothetical protein